MTGRVQKETGEKLRGKSGVQPGRGIETYDAERAVPALASTLKHLPLPEPLAQEVAADNTRHWHEQHVLTSRYFSWMRSLLAEEEIRRYNTDDVILVQDSSTRGYVYLILTGYCEVVRHDGEKLHHEANLQAGDILGEMAVITGTGTRNASVVARTPVTLCVFSEETFKSFIVAEGFQERLLVQWAMRPAIARQPQLKTLSSIVLEKLSRIGELKELGPGDSLELTSDCWCLLSEGEAKINGNSMFIDEDYGSRPFAPEISGPISTRDGCKLLLFSKKSLEKLRLETPQLNYELRKMRMHSPNQLVDWRLGKVDILK